MPADQLSLTFKALADPTRRAILARLRLVKCRCWNWQSRST